MDATEVKLTRRDLLRAGVTGLGALSLDPLRGLAAAGAALPSRPTRFLLGVNYPWIAYGHDFGGNAWGHDGMSTCGWTHQTYPDSQGLTDARCSTVKACRGRASLCVTADLIAGHPNRAKGEVYVDLQNHAPPGVTVPINLQHATASCCVWLPTGSAGSPSAPNGVQLFFKSEGWYSFYSQWQNIQPGWLETWTSITASLDDPPDDADPLFDPTRVIAVGLKVATNDAPGGMGFGGMMYLDDYAVDSGPPLIFDFEQTEPARDLATIRHALRFCPQRILRVFLFADGRAAPEFGPDGAVTGLDQYVFPDIDALLAAARLHGFRLILVVLDFSWCELPQIVDGAQLGGHSDVIRDPVKRQTLLDNALQPLLARYRNSPEIVAWDVFNEPEWAMREIPKDFEVGDPVSVQEMQDFVEACAGLVHAMSSSHHVTVGSARRMWLEYWKGLGIDLYQFHWYDHFQAEEPFPWRPYRELGLDAPCFIGEVPTAGTAHTVGEYIAAACRGGYSGLLVWSYRARDGVSDFSRAREPLGRWCLIGPCR